MFVRSLHELSFFAHDGADIADSRSPLEQHGVAAMDELFSGVHVFCIHTTPFRVQAHQLKQKRRPVDRGPGFLLGAFANCDQVLGIGALEAILVFVVHDLGQEPRDTLFSRRLHASGGLN